MRHARAFHHGGSSSLYHATIEVLTNRAARWHATAIVGNIMVHTAPTTICMAWAAGKSGANILAKSAVRLRFQSKVRSTNAMCEIRMTTTMIMSTATPTTTLTTMALIKVAVASYKAVKNSARPPGACCAHGGLRPSGGPVDTR